GLNKRKQSTLTHSGKQHHQQLNIFLQKVREASLLLHTEKSTFHLKGAFFVLYHFGACVDIKM
ncbi:MAG: hypothetical protein MUQ68_07940, partial [Crocinitomicaceae bacterium]|nr:hypothetical protein [Crocinitomicaceae bacterium]